MSALPATLPPAKARCKGKPQLLVNEALRRASGQLLPPVFGSAKGREILGLG